MMAVMLEVTKMPTMMSKRIQAKEKVDNSRGCRMNLNWWEMHGRLM